MTKLDQAIRSLKLTGEIIGYKKLKTPDLEKKLEIAKEWMSKNQDHPKYDEAMRRKIAIEDELALRYLE